MIIDAELIAEALEEIKPHDGQGDMAKKLARLDDIANSVQDLGIDFVDRKSLSAIIIGDDETAVSSLAAAYAKALKGYGFVDPVVHSIDWSSAITDICATRQMIEQSWAATKMKEAGEKAAGGTLVIKDIHNRPYAGWPDEQEATPSAEKGGLGVLKGFLGDQSQEEGTPVVVLTGPKAGIVQFFKDHPDMKDFFNATALHAGGPQPVMATETETAITVRGPLKLVIPSVAQFA